MSRALAVAPDRRHRCPDFLLAALGLFDEVLGAFQGKEAGSGDHIRALPHGGHDLVRIEKLFERGMVEPTVLLGKLNEKIRLTS